jgi:hypothetical protein
MLDTDATSMGTLITVVIGRFTVYFSAKQLTTADTQLPTDFTTMGGITMVLGRVTTVCFMAATIDNFSVIAGFTIDIPTF